MLSTGKVDFFGLSYLMGSLKFLFKRETGNTDVTQLIFRMTNLMMTEGPWVQEFVSSPKHYYEGSTVNRAGGSGSWTGYNGLDYRYIYTPRGGTITMVLNCNGYDPAGGAMSASSIVLLDANPGAVICGQMSGGSRGMSNFTASGQTDVSPGVHKVWIGMDTTYAYQTQTFYMNWLLSVYPRS